MQVKTFTEELRPLANVAIELGNEKILNQKGALK
jgi:hypothetical protein